MLCSSGGEQGVGLTATQWGFEDREQAVPVFCSKAFALYSAYSFVKERVGC